MKPATRNSKIDPEEEVAPRASSLIEAMRDIGYSLEAAVADIIDNSITAGSTSIKIGAGWTGNAEPWLDVMDNGRGMSEPELVQAMRLGSRGPLEARTRDDLGRFGLGLKTASFSQCRRLTVASRRGGVLAVRRWDLDRVTDSDKWLLITPDQAEPLLAERLAELEGDGTVVLWEKLDRLDLGRDSDRSRGIFNSRLETIREHLALVFHRFLSGEARMKKLAMEINGTSIEPFDPFNTPSALTTLLPEEPLVVNGEQIIIQPFILPHHSKVKPREYERLGGSEGYLRSQGFYIYRNNRLIIHGTWFRMARQEELTKLARVRVDIPNTLDHLWTIDVRKSRAQPPEVVKARLKSVLDKILSSAKRPYLYRGRVIEDRKSIPVWKRRLFNERVQYEISEEHPVLSEFRGDLDESMRRRFELVLQMIASTFPSSLFFADLAAKPERNDIVALETELLEGLAAMVIEGAHISDPVVIEALLKSMEPFASQPQFLEAFLKKIDGNRPCQ